MTNGDYIRNLSDKELVDVVTGCCYGCIMINKTDYTCHTLPYGDCKKAVFEWLQEEISK
jgi:hypothetical protein